MVAGLLILLGGCQCQQKKPTTDETQNNDPHITSFTASSETVIAECNTTLQVEAADPDGDNLSYAYKLKSGGGNLADSSSETIVFTAPNSSGSVTIEVEVTDGRGGRAAKTLTISVQSWNLIFQDDFNRANGAIGNSWSTAVDSTAGTPLSPEIQQTDYVVGSSDMGGRLWARVYRNSENYSTANNYQITAKYQNNNGDQIIDHIVGFSLFSANTSFYNAGAKNYNGTCVAFSVYDGSSADGKIKILTGTSEAASTNFTFTPAQDYQVKIQVIDTTVKVKVWQDGSTEPETWTLQHDVGTLQNDGNYLTLFAVLGSEDGAPQYSAQFHIDDVAVYEIN